MVGNIKTIKYEGLLVFVVVADSHSRECQVSGVDHIYVYKLWSVIILEEVFHDDI